MATGTTFQRPGRPGWVVIVLDARTPRCSQRVPSDLPNTSGPVSPDHDQLITGRPDPDALVDQLVWDGVDRPTNRHR
jgi:hypothetical protein